MRIASLVWTVLVVGGILYVAAVGFWWFVGPLGGWATPQALDSALAVAVAVGLVGIPAAAFAAAAPRRRRRRTDPGA